MNEKHMQYVLTVLKEGSFTGAAKKLYVSQPSLSQIIKADEANLGAPIFNRNTDPITLTPAGALYVKAAKQISTISTNLANTIVFAVLIVVLLVKPAGLLGKYVPEKV